MTHKQYSGQTTTTTKIRIHLQEFQVNFHTSSLSNAEDFHARDESRRLFGGGGKMVKNTNLFTSTKNNVND